MGIMDKVSNLATGGGNPVIGMISNLFNQFGGVGGLLQKFQQNGQGHIAQSWVGDGKRVPIEPEQLHSTLGDDSVNRMSQQTGMPSNQILQMLSQHLPGIVSKLTPGGKIPTGNISEDQLKQGGISEMLGGFANRKAG
jgi:uncharacterized protein YidB (DUF937 family)